MAKKQESVSDWMALAKAYDKAEKEQGVEPYVIVSLRSKVTGKELYRYDLPREMFWRWHWVIEWRAAKLLCMNPREGINYVFAFYDKKTGLEYGFGSLISKLTSAKAHITIALNNLQEYIERQRQDMFFNEKEDEIVNKFKNKISVYKAKVTEIENEIKAKVKSLES